MIKRGTEFLDREDLNPENGHMSLLKSIIPLPPQLRFFLHYFLDSGWRCWGEGVGTKLAVRISLRVLGDLCATLEHLSFFVHGDRLTLIGIRDVADFVASGLDPVGSILIEFEVGGSGILNPLLFPLG